MDGPKHLFRVRPLLGKVPSEPLEGPREVSQLRVLLPDGGVGQVLLLAAPPGGVVVVVAGGKPHQALAIDVRPEGQHGRDQDVSPQVNLPPVHEVRLPQQGLDHVPVDGEVRSHQLVRRARHKDAVSFPLVAGLDDPITVGFLCHGLIERLEVFREDPAREGEVGGSLVRGQGVLHSTTHRILPPQDGSETRDLAEPLPLAQCPVGGAPEAVPVLRVDPHAEEHVEVGVTSAHQGLLVDVEGYVPVGEGPALEVARGVVANHGDVLGDDDGTLGGGVEGGGGLDRAYPLGERVGETFDAGTVGRAVLLLGGGRYPVL